MSSETNVLGPEIGHVITSTLRSDAETVYLIGPTPEILRAVIGTAVDADGFPSVRTLAERSVLKTVLDEFPVASNAAQLAERETLDLRVAATDVGNALLVTDTSVTAIVPAGEQVAGLGTDDEAFVRSANETFGTRFEAAEPFPLRTPALSAIRSSLEAAFDSGVRSDFDAAFESIAAADGPELDEVTLSLLVAARNDVLLYDISKWGEDTGIASKATFSRTKTDLEDAGVIETEKVPIDVGRPRLRLRLGDDRLDDAAPERLAAVAADILG
jgi:hypothetical protein